MAQATANQSYTEGASALPFQAEPVVQAVEKSKRYGARSILHLFADTLRLPGSVILSSFAINMLGLALPLVILQIFDRVMRNQALNTLFLLIAGLFCVIIAETVLRLARNRMVSDIALKEGYVLQMRAGRRLLNTPYSTAAKLPPAVAADSIGAIDDLNQFNSGNARLALLDLPFVFLFLGVIWAIGGAIVIVPVVLVCVFATWTLRTRAAVKAIMREQMDLQHQRFSFYTECIKGISTVKSLAVEPQMQRRLERMLRASMPSNYALVLQTNRMVSAGQLFASLTMISVVTIGGALAIKGLLSIGAVAACSLIANRVSQPVLRIMGVWGQLEAAKIALDRSEAVMTLPQGKLKQDLNLPPAKVQLTGVWMGDDDQVQGGTKSGINLTVSPGEIAGIIIRDGLQRDAFQSLLRGRMAPDAGTVRIDEADPADEASDDVLQGMFHLGNDPAIFRGSILDNMSMFGAVNQSVAVEFAQQLGVEPVIQKLPEGYRTELDDTGARSLPRDLLLAITMVRAAAIRPRHLLLNIRRIPPDDVSTRACAALIEELRGQTTIVILGRTFNDVKDASRIYSMQDWKIEAVDPSLAGRTDVDAVGVFEDNDDV